MAICDPTDQTFQALLKLIDENESHFLADESEAGQRLHGGLGALRDGLEQISDLIKPIRIIAPSFDFSPTVPGNGFRSLCSVCDSALKSVFSVCSKIAAGRGGIVFRKKHFVREVEAWTQALGALCIVLRFTNEKLVPQCTAPDGDLITLHCAQKPLELITTLSQVPLHAFYGRCLGFHYVKSLHKTFQLLTISLSAYSQAYYTDGGIWNRTRHGIMASSQYLLSPELRARRLVSVMQYGSVEFIKSFWDLAETEVMRQLPSLVCPRLAVSQAVSVACEEQTVPSVTHLGRQVAIPPPCSHLPPSPIMCYLLSSVWRKGMPGAEAVKASLVEEPSACLLIHCHGGGFVTQSTKAQEMYLREWCAGTQCPLLSVDYSLSPAAPYPRPLEEALLAYCWALNHLPLLGVTGKRIILTGDSAGGSLVTGVTLRCLQLGIRPPDGLFLAYTPFMLKMLPSPAKLLAVMDPMLPLSFALRCLKAYAGHPTVTSPDSPPHKKPAPFGADLSRFSDATSQPKSSSSAVDNPTDATNASFTTTLIAEATTLQQSSKTLDNPIKNDVSATDCNQVLSSDQEHLRSVFIDGSLSDRRAERPALFIDGSLTGDCEDVDMNDDVGLTDLSASKLCLLSPSSLSEAGSDTMTTVSLNSDASKMRREDERTRGRGGGGEKNRGNKEGENNEEKYDKNEEEAGNRMGKEERSRKYVAEFLEKYVLDTRTDKEGRSVPVLRTQYSVDTDTGSDAGSGGGGVGTSTSYYNTAGAAGRALSHRLGAAKDAVVSGLSCGLSVGLYTVGLSGGGVKTSAEDGGCNGAPPGDGAVGLDLMTGTRSGGGDGSLTPSPVDDGSPAGDKRPSADALDGGGLPTLLEEFENVTILDDPFLNTLEAPHNLLKRFPATSIMSVEFDFCLDDGVCMAKLLRSLGVPVTLDVLSGLPHGFLNLTYIAPETRQGCAVAIDRIKALIRDPVEREEPK